MVSSSVLVKSERHIVFGSKLHIDYMNIYNLVQSLEYKFC